MYWYPSQYNDGYHCHCAMWLRCRWCHLLCRWSNGDSQNFEPAITMKISNSHQRCWPLHLSIACLGSSLNIQLHSLWKCFVHLFFVRIFFYLINSLRQEHCWNFILLSSLNTLYAWENCITKCFTKLLQ